MITGSIDLPMILAILPEILLLVLGTVILTVDLLIAREARRNLGWVTAVGLILIVLISILVARPGLESQQMWGGMIRFDWLGFVFKMMFLVGAAVTSLFAIDYANLGDRGEFYLLLLASTLGMMLMASASDLIMVYLAIETTSIPMYVLAGFMVRDEKSTESGYKYLLFGAMTSAIMLYGLSLLYGFSGATHFSDILAGFREGQIPLGILFGSLILVLVGFGFKISAAPLHFWAPDVYEGAPTPIAGFLSTASKAAGFSVLVRVMLMIFSFEGFSLPSAEPNFLPAWVPLIAAISVLTMTIGNLIALAQKNIKRLLAYSSIAHAGYALIGLVAFSDLGIASVVFYLIAYLITNLAAFGVVAAVGRVTGSDEIASYAGLSRRAPYLALAMLVAFLSLAGMPPLGGFVAKVFVFAAAIKANQIPLAVIGVLNSIIGLYYYLIVLKVVYLYRSEQDEVPLPVTRSYAFGLGVLTVAIVLIGSFFAPWFDWAASAAAALIF